MFANVLTFAVSFALIQEFIFSKFKKLLYIRKSLKALTFNDVTSFFVFQRYDKYSITRILLTLSFLYFIIIFEILYVLIINSNNIKLNHEKEHSQNIICCSMLNFIRYNFSLQF